MCVVVVVVVVGMVVVGMVVVVEVMLVAVGVVVGLGVAIEGARRAGAGQGILLHSVPARSRAKNVRLWQGETEVGMGGGVEGGWGEDVIMSCMAVVFRTIEPCAWSRCPGPYTLMQGRSPYAYRPSHPIQYPDGARRVFTYPAKNTACTKREAPVRCSASRKEGELHSAKSRL